MPKAGHYEYPVRDLDSCLVYLKKAHDQTQNLSMKRDTFAEALGLSPKTGPFGILVGSMAHYGLVETGDGYIRYTEVAKKALWGEPNEKMKAKQEAVRKVTLFEDIYKKYLTGASDDQLRLFLRESAGVDVRDAPSIAVDVSKIFKKVYRYLDNTNMTREESDGEGKNKMEISNDAEAIEVYKLGKGIEIKLPKENAAKEWTEWVKDAMDIILQVKNKGDKQG